MNKILKLFLVLTLFIAFKGQVTADSSSCQIVYGGGQVCPAETKFTIEKKVQKPGKAGEFVNNLTENDPRFAPGSSISFQITLKNTGTTTIKDVEVIDKIPDIISFNSGPGFFNKDTRELKFNITDFPAGGSQVFTITGKLAETSSLPTDKGIVCDKNNIKGVIKDTSIIAQSSSQFCIEKQIGEGKGAAPKVFETPSGLKGTPPTGPEALALVGLLPSGLMGYFLRKKSSIKS